MKVFSLILIVFFSSLAMLFSLPKFNKYILRVFSDTEEIKKILKLLKISNIVLGISFFIIIVLVAIFKWSDYTHLILNCAILSAVCIASLSILFVYIKNLLTREK